jgi:hypothetical protein
MSYIHLIHSSIRSFIHSVIHRYLQLILFTVQNCSLTLTQLILDGRGTYSTCTVQVQVQVTGPISNDQRKSVHLSLGCTLLRYVSETSTLSLDCLCPAFRGPRYGTALVSSYVHTSLRAKPLSRVYRPFPFPLLHYTTVKDIPRPSRGCEWANNEGS